MTRKYLEGETVLNVALDAENLAIVNYSSL